MIANKTKFKNKLFKQFIPYALTFAALLGLVFIGSLDKKDNKNNVPIMLAMGNNNYDVSVDQISELYMVAEIAQNVNLESKNYLNMDYTSAVAQYSMNQTSTTTATIEKPNLVNTELSRGVIVYTVSEGESMEAIANKFGISTDQIRWSNGLKTTEISADQTLYIPSVSGIVYTVKAGETVDGIAEKYGSDAKLIIAYNDLEASEGVSEGQRLVLPDGTLPETERPEYVPPAKPAYSGYSSTIHWGGGGNPMPYGWCTWFAWQWRHDNMDDSYTLPSGLGNARYWDSQLAGSFYIDKNPRYGDVFMSKGGYYGHVGIVTGVNDDGTITVTDMNGKAGWGRVGTDVLDAAEWGTYNFIHQRK